jgi:hypothetical protein
MLAPGAQPAPNVNMFHSTRTAMRLTSTPPVFAGVLSRQVLPAALSVLLLAPGLQAQPVSPATQEAVSAPALATTARPRYSSGDMDMAFGFMDSNKDGKVSREEAAAFRNVAKHFDAADTNKDQKLSREEFESALSRPKTP